MDTRPAIYAVVFGIQINHSPILREPVRFALDMIAGFPAMHVHNLGSFQSIQVDAS
jgi:hypothetical protein